MRKCGTLMHISSLPSRYSIGNFGKGAYNFIDFLKKSGQQLWQILPLGVTGYGDSPYQSFSSFAGNPYFIDPEELYEMGLVTKERLDKEVDYSNKIDYEKLYEKRYAFLKEAASKFDKTNSDYEEFCIKNSWWLDPFALFMTIKEISGFVGLSEWKKEYKRRDAAALAEVETKHKEIIDFWKIIQYFFFSQWSKLREYAKEQGIEIIGDIPIYVACDSADVWENPELFAVDNDLKPKKMAGCPPDCFNEDGQLWGNPIYDWERMKLDEYAWWKKRLAMNASMYDYIRIDHFRGFSAYYSIDAGEGTAKNGVWNDGPGYELFKCVTPSLGNTKIIAEDLGTIDDDVRKLLSDCGYPGMKVLEFGLDSDPSSEYLPHNYGKNCFAYIGTHDNDTFMSYYDKATDTTKDFILDYLGCEDEDDVCFAAVRSLFASHSDNVIISMQDYLGIADEGRMNTPSVLGGNWQWRANESDFTSNLAGRIKKLAKLYARYTKKNIQ